MRSEISILVLIAGLVLSGVSMVRTHRANVMLAQDAHNCATDAELVDLLRHPPPGGWHD